jgi:hypothetical protein
MNYKSANDIVNRLREHGCRIANLQRKSRFHLLVLSASSGRNRK